MASALTQSLSKDGQTTPTNNITLGGFKLTNVADGQSSTDAATYGQTLHTTGNQSLSGNLVLSGDLTVTGAVIFSQGAINVETLGVNSVASIASLTVPKAANINALTVGSAATINALTVSSTTALNKLAVSSTTALNTLTTTGAAALATASVASSLIVGAPSGVASAGWINVSGGVKINGTSVSTGVVSSSPAAISLSNSNAFAHGLGTIPNAFGAVIIAGGSPELGYPAGSYVNVSDFQNGAANSRAVSVMADATNVTITWSSSAPFLLSRSTFSAAAIDVSKWTVALWASR